MLHKKCFTRIDSFGCIILSDTHKSAEHNKSKAIKLFIVIRWTQTIGLKQKLATFLYEF